MRKTKIVCTMGPNTNSKEMMKKLVENGMDVARFNFSHGDHEEQKMRMDLLKEVRKELKVPVAILLDTKGPEIRTGELKDHKKVTLKENQTFVLTTSEVEGDNERVSITYKGLPQDVTAGGQILIDDGLICLEVQETTGTEIVCRVINGGELGEKKGINVPNVSIKLPNLTEKDKSDLLFGIELSSAMQRRFMRSRICFAKTAEKGSMSLLRLKMQRVWRTLTALLMRQTE